MPYTKYMSSILIPTETTTILTGAMWTGLFAAGKLNDDHNSEIRESNSGRYLRMCYKQKNHSTDLKKITNPKEQED